MLIIRDVDQIPVELAKIELPAIHTHIHRFIGYRITVFGVTVTVIAAAIGFSPTSTSAAAVIHTIVLCMNLLSVQILGGLTKAIWIFCMYGAVIERSMGGRGALQRWVGLNSYDGRFSTTYALYRGMKGLIVMASLLIAIIQAYDPMVTYWLSGHRMADIGDNVIRMTVLLIDVILCVVSLRWCNLELRPENVIRDTLGAAVDINAKMAGLANGVAVPGSMSPELMQFLAGHMGPKP